MTTGPATPPVEPRTAVFRRQVCQAMGGPPPMAGPDTVLQALARAMAEAGASGVVITDDQGRPTGIVTERDLARAAFRLGGDTPALAVMSRPVETIREDEYLYQAIARMRRADRRHMPVVDTAGRLTGLLDLHRALGIAAGPLMDQIDRLTRDDSVAGLAEVKAAQVDLADQLFRDNVPAPEIQALLSDINLDIYRRVMDGAVAAMKDAGHGPPPVNFAVIVMGSGGRGESFLFPDQDNGFILADYPDEQHGEIDPWFIALAERMVDDLDRIGLPRCNGWVMATNPLWRKTLSQWRRQITLWSRKQNSMVLRHCDIFFDFRVAWGDAAKGTDLRRHVTETAKGNRLFLNQMFRTEQDHEPPLGLFGRFRTLREKDAPGHGGCLNLKHTGTLPLVEGVRLLSLGAGLEAIPTLDRIAALAAQGTFTADQADELTGAYRHISHLLLRQQIADFRAGRRVTNYVPPRELTRREAHVLKESFAVIRDFQARVKGEFTGGLLG